MPPRLIAAVALLLVAAAAPGTPTRDLLNGLWYTFPDAQGSDGELLTNDGTGGLSWSIPPDSSGMVSGMIVMSTVACPSGWTRVSAADDDVVRGGAIYAATGGNDTHSHSLSGIASGVAPGLSGATDSQGLSLSGSVDAASLSHDHSVSTFTFQALSSGPVSAINFVASPTASTDISHSHSAGSLAGASHSHDTGSLALASHSHAIGTLAGGSASTVPAYYTIILCQKD